MARKPAAVASLQPLVEDFVQRIVAAVEAATAQRMQSAVLTALGGGAPGLPRRRGRPPKGLALLGGAALAPAKPRQKQLCPVPNCPNPAAPVFGMVCADHKDLPKAKIKEYREKRRAQKAKEKTKKAA